MGYGVLRTSLYSFYYTNFGKSTNTFLISTELRVTRLMQFNQVSQLVSDKF